jgi:hypothetical protein
MPEAEATIESFQCSYCRAAGSITWKDPATGEDQRTLANLARVSAGFHWEIGRGEGRKLLIVCNDCDEIQF